MKPRPLRFDDALPTLYAYLRESSEFNPSTDGVFLRDGFGRIAFCVPKKIPRKQLQLHNKALSSLLGRTAFISGALQDESGVGKSVAEEKTAVDQWVEVEGVKARVRLLDRRFFGRDWLQTPIAPIKGMPPVVVFGSMKGGVGRTTALFVLAIHLARRGKNILLVDLDLEAPGLASLLFEGDERPKYGVVDYLVENGLGGVSRDQLGEFVGTSRLTDRDIGQGRVDLAPATGSQTVRFPENMLGKLARALVEDPAPTGKPRTLTEQIRDLVEELSARAKYDLILVDARSGLAELSAGPLLGLGGNVLLFATDQPHTFESFRYMMAHLGTLPVPDHAEDWRERLHFVHSLAAVASKTRSRFDDKLYDLLSETFYEQDVGPEVFNFSLAEHPAPHHPVRVFFDQQFLQLNPIEDRGLLESDVYKAGFGSFIEYVLEMTNLKANPPNEPLT